MEQSKESFKELLVFGEEGEKEVATYLIKKGINILPLYQFNNDKAPLIINTESNYKSPDLTCFQNGNCYFIEVKTKRRWTICLKTNRIETGCSYRLYQEYFNLSKKTKIKLYIIFNHINNKPFNQINENSSGFFAVNIEEKGRYWDGINEKTGKIIHEPTYFWELKKLKRLNILE